MKKNDQMIANFTTMMDQKHRDVRHIVGVAISTCTYYYHHDHLDRAPRISADYSFWKNIFQTMCRQVYIRPEIYMGRLSLMDVIHIIERVLESTIYDEIPLNISSLKAFLPPSKQEPRERTRDRERDRDRDRHKVVKDRKVKSYASSVLSEGSDDDDVDTNTEFTELHAKRKSGKLSPVGSSSILTSTDHGKMNIIIPGK
jgi:hypothetical protein